MTDDRRPDPYREDPPEFPPVIFDDDDADIRPRLRRQRDEDLYPEREERVAPVFDDRDDEPPHARWDDHEDWDDEDYDDGRGGGDGRFGGLANNGGMLRIIGLVAVLGVIVLALVVPGSPVRLFGGGSSGAPTGAYGITASARNSMPALPAGFTAMSKIYDVSVPKDAKGPWSIDVTLTQSTTDATNLGFYSHDGSRWTRVANVELAPNGASASGAVTSPPGSLAVLRRTGQAKTLGLIVQAGDKLDTKAIEATSIVAVMGASVGTDGALQATAAALQTVAPSLGKAKAYLGVSGGGDSQAAVKNLASQATMTAQAEAIAAAAKGQSAAGVYLDYQHVPGAQKDAFSSFVKTVHDRLQRDQLGLVVGVPASAGANGAYDWSAIAAASEGVWVRGLGDPATYYQQMEQLFEERRKSSSDLGKVSLILDRRSVDKQGQQFAQVSLRDALTAASTIDGKAAANPASAGGTVALRALNLGDAQQNLRWDETARMVSFAFNNSNGARSVWIENRFSAAFRMDLASRFGLGGIAVNQAKQDDTLPDIWGTVVFYAQDGTVKLERPYGGYLAPCWQTSTGTVEGAPTCWSSESSPATVNWRAPQQQGTYSVRMIISDGVTFVGQDIALRVGTGGASPTPTPSATPSRTPTPTGTATDTPSGTATPTGTPRPTGTATATATAIGIPSATASTTSTPTPGTTPPPIQTSTPPPTAPTPAPGGVPPGPAGQ